MTAPYVSIEDARRNLDEWFSNGQIGNLIFSRGPDKDAVLILKERSIMVRDLPDEVRAVVELAFEQLECERAELRSGRKGGCGTVKLSRWMT